MPAIDPSMINVSVLRGEHFVFNNIHVELHSCYYCCVLKPVMCKPVNWTGHIECSSRVHTNADTMEQWGYLHWLMEASSQREEEKRACFILGFMTVGVRVRRGQGPTLQRHAFSYGLCLLFEGKSIRAHSLACLLPPRGQKHKRLWQALFIQPPATETYSTSHCRRARPLHVPLEDRYTKWEV